MQIAEPILADVSADIIAHEGGHQKRSEWVSVRRKRSVSCESFCSHIISQSGCMWHSQMPSRLPDSLCGRYWAGSEPLVASNRIASEMSCTLSPRLMQSFRFLSNRLLYYLVHSLRSSGTCHLHSLPCKPAPCRCVHSR